MWGRKIARMLSLFIGLSTGFGFAGQAAATTPSLMNFQATLNDVDSGEPLTGTRTIQFSISRSATSAASADKVWEEVQTVTLEDGRLDVLLGSVVPLEVGAFSGVDRWLQVFCSQRRRAHDAAASPRNRALRHTVTTIGGAFGGDILSSMRVDGQVEVNAFKMASGAGAGRVLTSTADGTAQWREPGSARAASATGSSSCAAARESTC